MKTLKGLLAGGLLASMLVVGTSANVYAATNEDTIAILKSTGVDAVYVAKANNYLRSANLSATQLDQVNVQLNIVADLLKAANVTDVTKLSEADKVKAMTAVTEAAKAAGLTVTFGRESSTSNAFASFKDATGAEVFRITSGEKRLKVTGSEVPVTLYAGILLALAGGVLLARKPKPIGVK